MRIAHLTTVDLGLALLLATELRVDVRAGMRVYGISAPGEHVAAIEALGVEHVAIPSLTRAWDLSRDLAAAGELYRALRRLRLDVLHTHNPKTGVLGRIIGRAAGIPVIVNTCHGLWAAPDSSRFRRALVYAIEGFAARFSDAELYQNDTDRQTLRHLVPARKARTVGNGIDLSRFRRDPAAGAALRAQLGVGRDEVLVGGVGRRVAEKGIREFAAAARALAGTARFVWVGPTDGDKPDALSEDLADVTFLGLRDDMPAVYSALDIFVLPSYREGFSRSAMEASACGCALVLSDIRGCREIGTSGEHLLLVPPRDPDALTAAVGRLIADPRLRERLARAATDRARTHFDQLTVAQASIDTYRAVLRRKKAGRWAGTAPVRPR